MRSPDEIMNRMAELEMILLDEDAYLDEGQQAELATLAWALDKDYDEALIHTKAVAEAKHQGLT